MSGTGNKVVICVTGWHFNRRIYTQLAFASGVDVYVVSHKSKADTPQYVVDLIDRDHVIYEANYGYDWGCYQQFLSSGVWKEYDYVFFMHDDIIIKNIDFIEPCLNLLEQYQVVGNGKCTSRAWKPGVPYGYFAHASYKPSLSQLQYDALRGSFFATKRNVLEAMEKFEVFWDPLYLTPGWGNYSTLASCARLVSVCGENCFGYLSDDYCESDYLSEMVRGDQYGDAAPPSWWKRKITYWSIRLCDFYMKVYWKQHLVRWRRIALALMEPGVALVSGRRLNGRWPSPGAAE